MIVGAGFGGIGAATRLVRQPVDVTIVDRRNHHVFQPLLYQVATAGLNPSDIAQSVRGIFQDFVAGGCAFSTGTTGFGCDSNAIPADSASVAGAAAVRGFWRVAGRGGVVGGAASV